MPNTPAKRWIGRGSERAHAGWPGRIGPDRHPLGQTARHEAGPAIHHAVRSRGTSSGRHPSVNIPFTHIGGDAMKTLKILAIILMAAAILAPASWGRGGGGCLEKGTPVDTPAGRIPIESLRAGDRVCSVSGGEMKTSTVAGLFEVPTGEYVELALAGSSVRLTPEHPVAVAPGVYRTAGELAAGDSVLMGRNRTVSAQKITGSRRVRIERTAFNLTVFPDGTFLAAGVVVHNKGGGCFLPDTPILRADGTWTSIMQIRPGDELLSFSTDGAIAGTVVQAVIRHQASDYFVVSTPNVVLGVTSEHPFFVGNGTFKTLDALKLGDTIYAYDGNGLTPQKITGLERRYEPTRVYNLQTDAPHTYFAAGLAVHNKGGGGGCFPAGTHITTPDGVKTIEKLVPGDRVLAVGRRVSPTTVSAIHETRRPVFILETDRGTLRTTVEHPLRLAEGGFKPAGELKSGQEILMLNGPKVERARVLGSREQSAEEPVYNLEVDKPHTFVAENVIVHNKGGSSYSSSRSSSSSSSSSGGQSGDDLDVLFIFLIFLGFPLVFFLIFFFALRKRFRPGEELDFLYTRAQIAPKAQQTTKMIEQIASGDSSMSPQTLEALVKDTFAKLQECWQARKYDPMKPLLMPYLYNQHLALIKGMVETREINMLDDLNIERIDLVNVRYTLPPDQREFTALITARVRDYYVEETSGKFLRGDRAAARFQEFWTFQLQDNRWLLREIEQARESDALKDKNFCETVPGLQVEPVAAAARKGGRVSRIDDLLARLAETDKAWDREAIKARVRLVFTHLFIARQSRDPDDIDSGEFFPQITEALIEDVRRRRDQSLTLEYRNLCVRKVDILLARNFRDNSKDEFTTRISAHAQTVVRKEGAVVTEDPDVRAFEEYWTFGRDDSTWKLKQVLPPASAQGLTRMKSFDEERV